MDEITQEKPIVTYKSGRYINRSHKLRNKNCEVKFGHVVYKGIYLHV